MSFLRAGNHDPTGTTVNYRGGAGYYWSRSSYLTTGAYYLAFTFGKDGTKNITASVPEPTSGLLLLLGIGAMALRRRRARQRRKLDRFFKNFVLFRIHGKNSP